MKFDCGKPWEEKHEDKKKWHKWFAWHPARIGKNECRWLEYIDRKGKYFEAGEFSFWEWEYRAL